MKPLGVLPLDMQIRLHADNGRPTMVADADGDVAGIYKAVAQNGDVDCRQEERFFVQVPDHHPFQKHLSDNGRCTKQHPMK